MSENSKIEWTDHTFNAWWGCEKISAGCKFCYAQSLDNRYHNANPHWGPGSDRKPMSENYWKQPIKWNAAAKKAGVPAKVFCSSMADVFEGHPQVREWRWKLTELIEQTPWLIWQLLTKRPENIMSFIPHHWQDGLPENVWIGTSVENQEVAQERISRLLQVPASVRFLSCEPLLGPVDLGYMRGNTGCIYTPLRAIPPGHSDQKDEHIHWVIAGGESGPHARPMHLQWARSLRDQCQTFGIPFHFKQWGEWAPATTQRSGTPGRYALAPIDDNGPIQEISYYPRQFTAFGSMVLERVGKKAAGRLLDGRTWDEFPNLQTNKA